MECFPPHNKLNSMKLLGLSVPLSATDHPGGNFGLSRVGKAHTFTLDNPKNGMELVVNE